MAPRCLRDGAIFPNFAKLRAGVSPRSIESSEKIAPQRLPRETAFPNLGEPRASVPRRSVRSNRRPARAAVVHRPDTGARRRFWFHSGLLSFAFAAALIASVPARAVTELQFWHAMDGALNDHLRALVDRFNGMQTGYRVVPVYKGSYAETLAAALRASSGGAAPHVLQVYDLGTAHMATRKRAVKPVYLVMREAGERFDASAFVPALASFYGDAKGNLLALPFNTSTPVLYINRDALRAAGVDRTVPFKSWYELQEALLEVRDKKTAACGLTTTWPAWIMIESLLAWHNEEFATRGNGYEGPEARLVFNTRLAIRHLSLMTSWLKAEIFAYSGPREEGEARFIRGECATLTASSASYADILRNARFQFAVVPLPHYQDIHEAPFNSAMGGAGLWAMAGKRPEEYKGVAKFFAFLAQPEVQANWHQRTGYLPITRTAYELTRKSGFYDKHPGTDVAMRQLIGSPRAYSRGLRLGDHAEIRGILDEEIEQAWTFKKSPKQALDDAVRRGDEILRRFEQIRN
jgi:sn-glycerol 3-phosphate transport system substrate-binding protein